ncbi:MAG: PKD domain-containing protein [Bacteroidales bacterium]|nr:PKD domain-containing protein [Bacteroidales bacterium]
MKKLKFLLLLIFISFFTFNGFTQTAYINNQPDTSNYPYWIEMMQDPTVNFYDVQKAFNTYWKDRPITKGCGWKPFKRWEYMMERHILPDGTRPAPDHVWNEYFKYIKEHEIKKSPNGDWENLGPFFIPGDNKGYNGLGRLNAITFHPVDPDIIYVGAPSGGLWKTEDHGNTWTSNTDNLPSLGVSSMVIDYNNPDIMYIGTGDRDAGDAIGLGVMKSINGGDTWEMSNSGMNNKTVGRLLMHPNNSNMIFAATSGGIYKTTDSGSNWDLQKPGNFKDIVFRPGDPSIIYAATGGNFYRSTDTGDTWTIITSGLPGGSRGVIGVSPANPDYVYFLITNGDSFKGLYRSVDIGLNFTEQSTTPNIMSWGCYGGSGGQAWYDLDIAIDPLDEDIIYAGGVNCFKSIDEGVTWEISSHWWGDCGVPAVHADLHVLEYSPLNGRLYAGNDGGIYWTGDSGTTWNEITDGLPISQVYKIGQSATVKDLVINGYQDNGTSTYIGQSWVSVYGGDGMECLIDYEDSSYSYASLYFGSIFRLKNNGGAYQVAGQGNHGITESGAWITPYTLHETNPNIMFIGYNNIWRCIDIKGYSFTWQQISQNGSSYINVVEHSPVNIDLFYYSRGSQLFRSDNVNDLNPAWTDLTSHLPTNNVIKDLEAHPVEPDIIYMTQGNKVYKSIDKGIHWTDISGSLPEVSMNTIVYYIGSLDGLYVGSDVGVFYMDNSMNDWIMFSSGLPVDASINEVEIYYDNNNVENDVIRAGTYGRGLWSSDLFKAVPVAEFTADQTVIPTGESVNFFDISSGIPSSWSWTFEGGIPSSSNDKNPSNIVYNQSGTFDVTLTASNSVGSDTKIITDYITVSNTLLPIVNFIASDSMTCIGSVITFTDLTLYSPYTWEWSFTPNTVNFVNGTNANSQNPEIEINEPGLYSVSLTAINTNGSNTLTKPDYIHNGGFSLPFTDDFESGSLSTKSWKIENPDDNITWGIASVGGNSPGSLSAWMNFYDYIVPPGDRDRLISPVLDFSLYSTVYMTFEHAYAMRHTIITDSLIIYISDDCGITWTRIFEGGDDGNGIFATHPQTTDSFVPAIPDDWCGAGYGSNCNTLDLSAWAGNNNIKIMFETYNHFGNNLYIDNVSITNSVGINQNSEENSNIYLFPNPSDGIFNISVKNLSNPLNIFILNIHGQQIYRKKFEFNKPNSNIEIDLSSYSKGVYFIRFINNEVNYIKKIIIK